MKNIIKHGFYSTGIALNLYFLYKLHQSFDKAGEGFERLSKEEKEYFQLRDCYLRKNNNPSYLSGDAYLKHMAESYYDQNSVRKAEFFYARQCLKKPAEVKPDEESKNTLHR